MGLRKWWHQTRLWWDHSRQLARVRACLKRDARSAAISGQPGEAHRLTAEAETVSKLYNPLFGNGFLLLFVALFTLSVLVSAGAAFLHKDTVPLVVHGKTRSATTYLAASGTALDLQLAGTRMQLSPVASGQSQNFVELGSKPPSTTADAPSGTLRLTLPTAGAGRARPSLLVPLAPGFKLGVSTDRDELNVAIFGAKLRGSIDVPVGARIDWELRDVSGDARKRFEEHTADVVDFEAQVRPTLPFVVNVRDPEAWELVADVERELTFTRVAGASNPTVEISSGLESASVQFLDLEKTLSIPKGDFLTVEMTTPGRLLLRRASGSEVLDFEFEGEASKLRSGRQLGLADRRPTWLEWAAQHTVFRAWWSGLVLVWGLLWGIFKMKEG
jgi:hypothetical protein